jgi:hypothetical protein
MMAFFYISGETMAAFSDHQRIPAFGFGDLKCADREVRSAIRFFKNYVLHFVFSSFQANISGVSSESE